MNVKSEFKVCKNKNCKKILPKGYKYEYCENCQNRQAHTAKNVFKGVVAGMGAMASIALVIITKGKIDFKKK